MTARAALFLAAVLCGLSVPRLAAQTLPLPSPPPEIEEPPPAASPGRPAEAPRDERTVRPQPWEYETTVGFAWDSNLYFEAPDGPDSLALIPRGSLARVFGGPRGKLRLEAQGRYVAYTDRDQQGRGYAGFSLVGDHRSSLDTTWRTNVSYEFGHTDSSQPLVEQGVLLPLSRTRTLSGLVGVTHKVGAQTSLLIDGRIYSTQFDVPALVDGASVRGTVSLERRSSIRSAVALVYSLEGVRATETGDPYLTHFGSLQWTRLVSPRTAVLLEAGAAYTPAATRAALEREVAFFGGMTLTRQVKRSSITAFGRREVVPAFGTGVSRLEIRAGLRAGVPLGRWWDLSLAGTHIIPDSPTGAAAPYADADEASVALGRRIGERIRISAESSYRRRGAIDVLPATDGFNAGLYLSLVSPSRAGRPRLGSGG